MRKMRKEITTWVWFEKVNTQQAGLRLITGKMTDVGTVSVFRLGIPTRKASRAPSDFEKIMMFIEHHTKCFQQRSIKPKQEEPRAHLNKKQKKKRKKKKTYLTLANVGLNCGLTFYIVKPQCSLY